VNPKHPPIDPEQFQGFSAKNGALDSPCAALCTRQTDLAKITPGMTGQNSYPKEERSPFAKGDLQPNGTIDRGLVAPLYRAQSSTLN